MKPEQLGLYDIGSPDCIFRKHLDAGDNHCFDLGMGPAGYQVIAEDSPCLDHWLGEIRGIGFNDVVAKDIAIPTLPAYIPTITTGSGKLFTDYKPDMVAVKLGDVVSMEKLRVADSLEKRFGIPLGTSVILQCYAKDRLLENIWPHRFELFPKLAALGFSAVTGLNYSVWYSQPHAESLINLKRTLLTYEALQAAGMPAIPHIFWRSRVNVDEWVDWLTKNPCVKTVAIDMQTLRNDDDWELAISRLKFLVAELNHPIHFLVTGPYKPLRLAQLRHILPSMSLTNGSPARMAFASHQIMSDGVKVAGKYSSDSKSLLLQRNVQFYQRLMMPQKRSFTQEVIIGVPKHRSSGVAAFKMLHS